MLLPFPFALTPLFASGKHQKYGHIKSIPKRGIMPVLYIPHFEGELPVKTLLFFAVFLL